MRCLVNCLDAGDDLVNHGGHTLRAGSNTTRERLGMAIRGWSDNVIVTNGRNLRHQPTAVFRVRGDFSALTVDFFSNIHCCDDTRK